MTKQEHPGQILATELVRQLHVPANRITQIIQGKRGITSDSALRFGHWLDDAPEFWMGLQAQDELREAAPDVGREIRSLPRHPAQVDVR